MNTTVKLVVCMADDVAALIHYLGFDHADILGYSLGGGVHR